MTEEFLQYIWRYNLFDEINSTTNGNKLEIISVGQLNTDSGPDFFNAKIRIDDTIWVGNIEIHINSSDWKRHNHHNDEAYNNVILHIVKHFDTEIYDTKARKIPTAILSYANHFEENYQNLLANKHKIKCENRISELDRFTISSWISSLAIERLSHKSESIIEKLTQNNFNWEETFYQTIFRYFGMGTNSEPFEMLARLVPLKILGKHKNNLQSIEAILFGTAGFLQEDKPNDTYYKLLKREYAVMKAKFDLQEMDKSMWKFMRLRPVNFPTIRIAQTAMLIYNSTSLFSKIIEADNIDQIKKMFNANTTEYWDTHYNFNKESTKKVKKIGNTTINIILINVIVAFIFVYGKEKNLPEFTDKALSFLEEIKAESNSITKYWTSLNIISKSAFDSQALIELHNEYCLKNKCLNCRIGNKLINKNE